VNATVANLVRALEPPRVSGLKDLPLSFWGTKDSDVFLG
jgi:hypothetical protein